MDYKAQEKLHRRVEKENPFLGIIDNNADRNELTQYLKGVELITEISISAISRKFDFIVFFIDTCSIDNFENFVELFKVYIDINQRFQHLKSEINRCCSNGVSYSEFIDIMSSFEKLKRRLCQFNKDLSSTPFEMGPVIEIR